MKLRTSCGVGLLLIIVFCLQACTSTVDLICQEQSDCEDWNAPMIEDCQISGAASMDLADAVGCADEADDAAQCMLDHSQCIDGKLKYADACKDFSKIYMGCLERKGS